MVKREDVEFFKKKGRAEFYVPPEEEPPEEPSKQCYHMNSFHHKRLTLRHDNNYY